MNDGLHQPCARLEIYIKPESSMNHCRWKNKILDNHHHVWFVFTVDLSGKAFAS